MEAYRVPAGPGDAVHEAKGSLFYGRAVRIEDESDVQALLAAARAAHPEANHHAYAYRLGATGEVARFSDDGEPGGTAGRPIMEVLLREGLVYAAAVVSRHFGGTLLGAGGLVRAYGGTAAAAVRAAGASAMHPHVRLQITLDYSLLGAMQQEIRHLGLRPPQEEFGAQVTLTVTLPQQDAGPFRARIADLSAGSARIATLETVYLPLMRS
jgi:uncharacterized YigZ family protein